MKAAHSCRNGTSIIVRLADRTTGDSVAVVIPDSGADVEAVERALIAFALERTAGNRTHAARFLGLSRSALIYRMHKHGLARNADAPDGSGPDGGRTNE